MKIEKKYKLLIMLSFYFLIIMVMFIFIKNPFYNRIDENGKLIINWTRVFTSTIALFATSLLIGKIAEKMYYAYKTRNFIVGGEIIIVD